MKFFFIFCSFIARANLYIETSFYQKKEKKPITTKHHLFLNRPYDFRYWDRRYILTLKKIEQDQFIIETETYDIKPLKYVQLSGSIATLKLHRPYILEESQYRLIITPEKVVNTPR